VWEEQPALQTDREPTRFTLTLPAEKIAQADTLRITVGYFTCPVKSTGVCLMHAIRWEIPVQAKPNAQQRSLTLDPPSPPAEQKSP
jgi:hypothetical protein